MTALVSTACLLRKLRLRAQPRVDTEQTVELDSQGSGSLPLTMTREVILLLCTHALHSFSPHGLMGKGTQDDVETGGQAGAPPLAAQTSR